MSGQSSALRIAVGDAGSQTGTVSELATAPPSSSTLAVLRERNFWPYFVGNLCSNIGTWFQNLAMALLIYRITGSVTWVAIVNFSQFAATVLLVGWTGPAADRYDRRRLVIAMQTVAAGITVLLTALSGFDRASAPVLVVAALLVGVTSAFAVPAMQALLPQLVPKHALARAVTLNSVTYNLARAAGPVLGALVISTLGVTVAFALNAVSFAALIGGLFIVRPAPRPAAPPTRPRLRDSLAVVRADRRLTLLLLTSATVSFCSDPVGTLTPYFAEQVLGRRDTFAGVLVGAFGAGAVIAALTIGRAPRHVGRRLGLMLTFLGVGLVAFAVQSQLVLAIGSFMVGGFGYLAANALATSRVQMSVDDRERGRVMAIWSLSFLGIRPIASLLDGAFAGLFDPRVACVLMALPAFVVAAVVARDRSLAPDAVG